MRIRESNLDWPNLGKSFAGIELHELDPGLVVSGLAEDDGDVAFSVCAKQ